MRQAKVVADVETAPSGRRFARFTNTESGKASRALQGMAIDGRAISRVDLSATVRGRELGPGPTPKQRAAVIITFYDQRRAVIESHRLANWQGTFDWRRETKTIRVPLATREAIVRLGLLGGVGQLDLDEVELRVERSE